jgi:hypothetical protein
VYFSLKQRNAVGLGLTWDYAQKKLMGVDNLYGKA